ncbi:MAG: hemin receptor [Alphaproteobacteria bacterium]|nr:hemin receptor [Alphaproteobacteria bacterium]
MTPKQVELLRSSWRNVGPFADHAAHLFYTRLFEIAPEIQDLFKFAEMPAQRQKLLIALNLAVINAHTLNTIAPELEAIGRRHASYGVKNSHYEAVGQALVWTLEQDLGSAFIDDVRKAWTDFYNQVADAMMNGPRSTPQNAA